MNSVTSSSFRWNIKSSQKLVNIFSWKKSRHVTKQQFSERVQLQSVELKGEMHNFYEVSHLINGIFTEH